MNRRGLFKSFVLAAVGLVAARAAKADEARATKCVYHLADIEKAAFVLGNLRNHLEGAGAIELAVVVHGPALRAFAKDAPNRAILLDAQDLMKSGVAFHACAHTLAAQHWTLADLTPGFRLAAKGGVVLLADLQAEGWAYLRP
jgi:intracellular sulfur oxidation DsrE/DsrF family protein